ncbi:Phosphoglycerate mutase domain protein [mine drainage metagenome]|uniref:Phosphoglycerate mutase domain protein n=1 Tax=mine drainage metagenome TaxID=410659 RepID=T1AV97_9ZZZZ
MKILEHRRHSRRDPGGTHLNREGVALARQVGRSLDPFDRVVTSPKPRAIETAVAFGCAVDAVEDELGGVPDDIDALLEGADSFAAYALVARRRPEVRRFMDRQAELWQAELDRVPDRGRLLLVSHGGLIELGALGALPVPAAGFGAPLGLVEGVRLYWDGRFVGGEVVRLSTGTPSVAAARTRTATSSGVPSARTGRRSPRSR